LQVVFDPFQAGHVGKRNRLLAELVALGGAFAEARQDAAAHELISGPAEHDPHADEEQHGDDHIEHQHHAAAIGRLAQADLDRVLAQEFGQIGVGARVQDHVERFFEFPLFDLGRTSSRGLGDRDGGRILELADQLAVVNVDFGNISFFDLIEEEVVVDGVVVRDRAIEQQKRNRHQQDQQHGHARRTKPRLGRLLVRLRIRRGGGITHGIGIGPVDIRKNGGSLPPVEL
jgi:hypothetical protein